MRASFFTFVIAFAAGPTDFWLTPDYSVPAETRVLAELGHHDHVVTGQ